MNISKEQLAHITKLQSLAQLAKRIKAGDIPASSIRSVARHYPELVARLKRLLPKTSKAYNEIIKASQDLAAANKTNREYIDNLEAEAKKAKIEATQAGKKPAPPAETPIETPTETGTAPPAVDFSPEYLEFTLPESGILEQTFKSMRPEDRIALLDNFEHQFGEIERLAYEAEENAVTLDEAIDDFLRGTSAFRLEKIQRIYNKLMKRKDNLRRITLKEYREITGRSNPPSTVPIIYGEKGHKYVDWDLALDFATREYGFDSTEEMFDALERNAKHIQKHNEAVVLSDNLNRQHRQMSDVIKILQNVMITNQEYVPADITGSESGVTPAQVPIIITSAMRAQLESFGYSSEEINNMVPSEAWDLINGTMVEPSPAPAQAESLESLKQQLSDMLEINAEVETFTQEEIASLEKEIAEREVEPLAFSSEGGIETKIPEPIEGEPEPGVSKDFWGYETPVRPKGKGIVTQISMDDQVKLQEYYKENGELPTDKNYVIKPVDNLDDLSEPPKFYQMENEPPSMMDEKQRQAELNDLVKDIKLIKAGKLDSYNKARAERKYELEKVRQGGIDKGYIMQPMFGGKIYDDAFIDEVKRWYLDNRGSNIVGKIAEVSGTLRVTKAALDFSAMAIQGMPTWGLAHSYLFVNPKMGLKMMAAWYKSFVISTGAFFSPHIAYRYLQENSQARMQRAALGGSTRAIDIFAGLHQQGFVTTMLSHRFSPFNRAEIAFVTAGEMVRNTFWEIMSEQSMKKGDEQQLVMFLDRMTGVMNTEAMGVPTLVRQIESAFLWFAPQYSRACLSVLNHLFKGGYNGKMARKALGGMVAAGSIFYMAILFAQGMLEGKDEEEIWDRILEGFGWTEDPITGEGRWAPNARFMSIEIGDRNYGIGGFWYGLVRLVGNISSVIEEQGDKEMIDLVKIIKNGKLNRDNPFVYWWYCRASPFTGLVNDLATHRDFLGYPIETWDQYLEYFLKLFEPIWIEGALNPVLGIGNEEPGDPDGLVLNIIGEIFGLRVNRKYAWQAFYDKAEEYIAHMTRDELNKNQIEAWEKGKLGWKQLDKRQQLDLLAKYPDLKELQEAAEIDSALRDDSLWADWNEVIDRAKKTYYDEVKVLSDQFRAGEISSNEYRDGLRDAGLKYGSALSIIESDKRFEGLYEFLENTSESGAQYEYEFNKALAEYQATVLFADDLEDENGNYDWDLRDARVKAFIDTWGMDMYEGILKYFETKKKHEGADDLYLKKTSDVEKIGREYWDIEPDAKDIDGNNMRNAYRQSHPEIDAMLAFWGYGGRLQTKEAYDIVKGWAKEYGVPLSSVGKGLPPDYLVDQYFEYSSILNDYSSASAEMQLFRYNNPQFNDWAMEEWGWQELNIKSVEALEIKTKWSSEFNEYESAEDKQAYLETNTEFWKAKLEYDAYTNELPEEVIPDYQEWYMTDMSGYHDDIYLIEHPEFYNAMVEAGLWKERDFSKVPSRIVSELWDEYNTKEAGKERKQFRLDNPALDAWLVEVKGYTPVSDDYLDVPREEVFAMT
ncbi:MAG: hypothetical protein WC319_07270 [Candidatus Paceibacterota bacterium]